MVKRLYIVGLILLASLLVVGCGIPKEDYEAMVAERDTAQAEVTSLQNDLDAARSLIQALEGNISTLEIDLAESEATVATLQADLEAANAEVERLKGDVSTQQLNLLSAELKIVKDPRHFETLEELTAWLHEDDTDTEYADEDILVKAFILQVRALRDGYLLPVTLYSSGGAFWVENNAVIGESIYKVWVWDDETVKWKDGLDLIPSHPLPLD